MKRLLPASLLLLLASCDGGLPIDETQAESRAFDRFQRSAALGYSHTCFLEGSTVACSGNNSYGQLGNGTYTSSLSEVVTGIESVSALAAGQYHTCALSGGTVSCWGRNNFGQLGPNAAGDRSATPVPVASGVGLAAGASHTCVIGPDGTASCWGQNSYGQLGDGGGASGPQPRPVSGLTGVVDLAAGIDFTCALRSNGGVMCWGSNSYGQLGRSGSGSTVPVAVSGITSATGLTAGYRHACVTLADGSARCWGQNSSGDIGDGTTTNRSTPVPVAVTGVRFTELAAGYQQTCGRTDGGRVYCWGSSNWGSVGNGSAAGVLYPTPQLLAPTQIATVTSGPMAAHTCALRGDGERLCWGWNAQGQIGDGTTNNASTPRDTGSVGVPAATLSAGWANTCALQSGRLLCWGDNSAGQLGNGTTTSSLSPTPAAQSFDRVVALTAGNAHGCLASADGTAWCWGTNRDGQLGDGTPVTMRPSPSRVSGLTGVVDVVAGSGHSCALTGDGKVHCWGDSWYWQLGFSDNLDSNVPRQVPALPAMTALAAGITHTCGLAIGGGVWCWGDNSSGQLGQGNVTGASLPARATGLTDAIAIAAGGSHTCAVTADGRTWCWGSNSRGQLGDGTLNSTPYPVAVGSLAAARTVTAGWRHTCAITTSHIIECWGANDQGQLADGTLTDSLVPKPVGMKGSPPCSRIAAGGRHTCASTTDGLLCWGDNTSGQLGAGTTWPQSTPVVIPWY